MPSPEPGRRRRSLLRLAVLALSLARSAEARAGTRALPPEAGPRIVEALKSAGPALTLVSVRIDKDVVWANLCPVEDQRRCISLQLSDPRSPCAGTVAGAFCVGFPGLSPAPAAQRSLLAAFSALAEAAVWKEIEAPVAEAPKTEAHPRSLALILLLTPLLAGLGAARALRALLADRPRLRRLLLVTLSLGCLAAGPLLAPRCPRVGAWDLVLGAAMGALGLLAGSSSLDGRALSRRLGLALSSVLLALFALEIAARALPAPPATFPPPERARLFFEAAPGDEACAPLYPAELPSAFAERTSHLRPGSTRVLHVGDSMVEGVGVAPGETFVAELGRLTPAIDQINAGFAGTSTDFELMLLRAWVRRLRPSRVVLHVFGYNDLAELDRAYPCCPDGPLLDASPEARARCATPGQISGRLELFALSPAPYPLRVATERSALARRAVVAFAGAGAALKRRGRAEALGPEQRFERFADLLRIMKRELDEAQVALSIVYLPARAALESAAPRETGDYRLRGDVGELARSLGAPFLDPWELLEGSVAREGADHSYLPPPDIHFTREGHRLVARWLAERLTP
jgi:lysophospholipase L1-like esterase